MMIARAMAEADASLAASVERKTAAAAGASGLMMLTFRIGALLKGTSR